MTKVELMETSGVKIQGFIDFGKYNKATGEHEGMVSRMQVFVDGKPLGPHGRMVLQMHIYQCPVCKTVYFAGKEPPECDHKF